LRRLSLGVVVRALLRSLVGRSRQACRVRHAAWVIVWRSSDRDPNPGTVRQIRPGSGTSEHPRSTHDRPGPLEGNTALRAPVHRAHPACKPRRDIVCPAAPPVDRAELTIAQAGKGPGPEAPAHRGRANGCAGESQCRRLIGASRPATVQPLPVAGPCATGGCVKDVASGPPCTPGRRSPSPPPTLRAPNAIC